MEQNFQTSFIPKAPIVQDETPKGKQPMSLFLVFSIIMFLTIVVVYGGLFFYQITLKQSIEKYKADLELAKGRFEIDRINELKVLDKRLIAGSKILDKHITISPIFQILQEITMKSVRYNNFTYNVSENGEILIKLNGQAQNYRSIALQSDLYSSNKNLIQPVFSNLNLDEKGNVLFQLDFKVDPLLVNYKQKLDRERIIPVSENNSIPDLIQ